MGCDLKALDVMNSSRLWMICDALGRDPQGYGCCE